jgi:DNA polymerase-3 subunit epsilon
MGLADSLSRTFRRTRSWQAEESLPWRDGRFCVIDVETTGLDLQHDSIISVGVAQVVDGRISSDVFYEVARPARPISETAMCLHALTADELASAPPLEEVVERLRVRITGSIVVAHAAWVERAFLNRALRPLGERLPDRLVDTAALARHLGQAEPTAHEPSLEALALRLGLPIHTPHHALGDAMTTAEVFLVQATALERRNGLATVDDLLTFSSRSGL